jgi:hypothetical protein
VFHQSGVLKGIQRREDGVAGSRTERENGYAPCRTPNLLLTGQDVKDKASSWSLSRVQRSLILAIVVIAAPLWLAALLIVALARLIQLVVLYAMVWAWWIGWAQRRVLFVYSDSPNWKAYIETSILPKLPSNTVVLNWSHRRSWSKFSFSVMLFRCFAGGSEFNPIGLIFERFDVVERYRFWQPLRDAKHGHLESLLLVETQFLKHAAG